MKKTLAIILVLCIAISLAACSASSTAAAKPTESEVSAGVNPAEPNDSTETPEKGKINCTHLGVVVPGLSNEFWITCANACENLAKEYGIKCTVVSYDQEIAKELTCIENLATAGCDAIFYCANDPAALEDISRKYKDEGVMMIPYAGIFDDKDCYTVSIPVGQREMGVALCELASDWVDQQFPDAEEGSVGVVILGGRSAVEFTNKTDGFWEIEKINPKCKVLKEYLIGGAEGSGDVQGATFCDMTQVEFGTSVNVILCLYDGFMIGANESYMRYEGFEDRSDVAVFGCDCSSAICDMILASETGGSVIRGATANAVAAERLFAVLAGTAELNENNETDLNMARVTAENAAAYKEYLGGFDY